MKRWTRRAAAVLVAGVFTWVNASGAGVWLLAAHAQDPAAQTNCLMADCLLLPELAAPIVAGAADPATGGFWLLGRDGGVFALAGAPFYGSPEPYGLTSPAVTLIPSRDDRGYWVVTAAGGIFGFGDAVG